MADERDRREEARARVLEVAQRARELAERLVRLEAGGHSTAADVEWARRAAEDSLAYGLAAHARAASAHRRAAQAHRSAADMADRAGYHARAEEHRAAARADDEAAAADETEAGPHETTSAWGNHV